MKYLFNTVIALLGVCMLLPCNASYGHTPHDDIDVLLAVADQVRPEALFVITFNHSRLLRSLDQGASWKDLGCGLDNRFYYTDLACAGAEGAPRQLFLSTDGDGVYRSEDLGSSWGKYNRGLEQLDIAHLFSLPGDESSSYLFAAGKRGGLFRNDREDPNWVRVIGKEIVVKAMTRISDQSGITFLAGDSNGTLYASSDGGLSWETADHIPNAGAITCLAARSDPSAPPVVLAGTSRAGVYRSLDRGKRFSRTDNVLSKKHLKSLFFHDSGAHRASVFATCWNDALFESTDNGLTWTRKDRGLTKDAQADTPLHRSPHFNDIAAVRSDEDFTLYLAGFDGLFKSTDGGAHWQQLETLGPGRIVDVAISSASDNHYWIAATTYGGGAFWLDSSDMRAEILNVGLKSPRLTDLVFAPDDRILFSAGQGHLLKTADHMQRWDQISTLPGGIAAFKRRTYYLLHRVGIPDDYLAGFFPRRERIAPYPSRMTIVRHARRDRAYELFYTTRGHGVMAYSEASRTASVLNDDLGSATSIVAAPDVEKTPTLFVTAGLDGIFKSANAGRDWKPVNQGLSFLKDWKEQVASGRYSQNFIRLSSCFDIKLMISPDYASDQTLFAFCSEGIYRSSDGGHSWQPSRIASRGNSTHTIAMGISPDFVNDGTVLASLKGEGLVVSHDRGRTFEPFSTQLIRANHAVTHILFSPVYAEDHTIYAASEEQLFRSPNNGEDWYLVPRPIRYEESRERIQFEGKWETRHGSRYSTSRAKISHDPGSRVRFQFRGSGVRWIGPKNSALGRCRILLDGKLYGYGNQHAVDAQPYGTIFSIADLPPGVHTLEIENAPQNAGPTGIAIDAFDVIGEEQPKRVQAN